MNPEKLSPKPDELLNTNEKGPVSKSMLERFKEVCEDPEAQESAKACGRLFANLGITAIDIVPGGVGEIPSWAADAAKMLPGDKFDLSPDVSTEIAVGSEALEAFTGGAFPSHGIETIMQAKADAEKGHFEKAKSAIYYVVTGKENYVEEHENATPNLDSAANVFASGQTVTV